MGNKGKDLLKQHSGTILSQLGLGEAEDGEVEKNVFTKMLSTLGLETGMITNMTSSITTPEAMASVVKAFKDPSSIGEVIKKQTGWDQSYVDTVTDTIKGALGSSSAVRLLSESGLALVMVLVLSRIVL